MNRDCPTLVIESDAEFTTVDVETGDDRVSQGAAIWQKGTGFVADRNSNPFPVFASKGDVDFTGTNDSRCATSCQIKMLDGITA